MIATAFVAVAACAALAVGCGGDGLPQRITPAQESDLHTLVDRGRAAAAAGDLAATRAALTGSTPRFALCATAERSTAAAPRSS